tara:strand:- start:393 stop:1103 length:711 start_codon:yes stop_codon:yes gene_type:complete
MPYLGVRPADITSAAEAEIAGDLTVDTNTLKVDSSNNRVGVGVVAPDVHLHVQNDTNPRFRVEDTTNNVKFDVLAQNSDVKMGNNSNHDLRIITNNSERLRVLAAGGLTFNGDTATVNALDDYEEGTFTPQVYHSSTDNATFSAADGNYTKIGNTVTCQIRLDSGNTGTAGTFLVIDGLPFTVNQGQQNQTIGVWGSNPSAQVGNIHGFNPPRVFKGGSDVTTQMTFFTALLVYKI